MLAEPWLLKGHQETRLREFLELLDVAPALDPEILMMNWNDPQLMALPEDHAKHQWKDRT